jgi:hypothetical protein
MVMVRVMDSPNLIPNPNHNPIPHRNSFNIIYIGTKRARKDAADSEEEVEVIVKVSVVRVRINRQSGCG